MFEEISKCGKLLNKYGGHPMAAGISLDIDKIDEFRKALNENQTMTENVLTPTVWIDVPMPVDYVGYVWDAVDFFSRSADGSYCHCHHVQAENSNKSSGQI